MQPPAFDPFELGNILIKLKFNNFTIAKSPELALMDAKKNYRNEIIAITGSMYLLNRILKLL
jgi:folylpolyglutamate synthase/dihydropteroate synthase